uniref:Uncharacterized protein n=1 Tax=Arundo donax TaxID=35708 RepID=A0A0A9BP42_ARUDO
MATRVLFITVKT